MTQNSAAAPTEESNDEFNAICTFNEHREERKTYEDETSIQWVCDACGAEGWEDK